jgi:hypothetical protein
VGRVVGDARPEMKSPGYRVPTAVGGAPDQSGYRMEWQLRRRE